MDVKMQQETLKKCCVPYCDIELQTCGRNVQFYPFPTDNLLKQKWMNAIYLYGMKNNISVITPGSHFVCSRHFSKESSYRMPTVFWDEDGHCRIVNENMEAKENDDRKFSHSEQVLHKLNEFRKNNKLVDITVNVSNIPFQAHKAILSVTCPFFEELFEKYPTVLQANLSKASEDAFSALLTYFYSGVLEVNVLNIHEIEHLAKILQVEKVLDICTQWRKKNSLVFLSESSILSGDHGYCKEELSEDFAQVSKQASAKLESKKSIADKSIRQSKRIQEKIPLKKLRNKKIVETKHVRKKTNSYDGVKKTKTQSTKTKEKPNSQKKAVKQNKTKNVKQNKTIATRKHRQIGVKQYRRIGVKKYKTTGARSNKRMPGKKTEKKGVKTSKIITIKKGKMIRVEPTKKKEKVKQVENLLPQHNFIIQSIRTKKISPQTATTNANPLISPTIENKVACTESIPVAAGITISDPIQSKPDEENTSGQVRSVSQNIRTAGAVVNCEKLAVTDINITNETKTAESDKFYICTECGWKAPSYDSMKKHLTSVHKKMSILSLRPFTSDFLDSVKVRITNAGRPIGINSRVYQSNVKLLKEAAEKRTGSFKSLLTFQCHLCDFKTTTKPRLQRHKLTDHFSKDILHECDICSKIFPTQFRLDRHLKEHLYPSLFGCGHCDYKSNTTAKIRHHIRIYHDGHPCSFQCVNCTFKCENSFSFLHHLKREHEYQPPKRKRNPVKNASKKTTEKKSEENKNPVDVPSDNSRLFGCGYCDYIGPTSFRIKRHISSVHKDQPCLFKCVSCPFQEESNSTFLNHLKREHNCCLPKRSAIIYKKSPEEKKTKEKKTSVKNVKLVEMNMKKQLLQHMFGCGYCHYTGPSAFRIRCHIKSLHKDDPCLFKCLICPFQEENSLYFVQHLRNEHNLTVQTNTFRVNVDPRKDNSVSSKTLSKFEHRTNSTTESSIKIPENSTECNISSTNPTSDSLSEVNKVIIDYKCRFCPKILKSHWARQKHILLKHATMAHHCPYCSYIGQKASIIRIHVRRVHNKDVCIKCPLCSYKVNSLPEFRHHMKKEHEVQPSVPDCKEGSLVSDIETDAEEVSKENMSGQSLVYPCTICGKSYNIYRSLLTHKRKHFNSERFGCPYCVFTTIKADEMRSHVRNIHNENPALKCNWCNFCCNDVHKIREHVVAEHKLEAFPNKEKPTTTPYDDIHKLCAMVKSNVDSYKCDHCDGSFSNKKNFITHSSQHYDVSPVAKTFSCPYCNFNTVTIHSIRQHIRFKHNRKTIYKCAACSYENNNFTEFRSHMYSEHREDFKLDAAKQLSKTPDQLAPKSSVKIKKPSKTISLTKAVTSSAKKIASKKLSLLIHSKEKNLIRSRVQKAGITIKLCGFSCVHCQHFEMLEDDMKTHIKKSHQGFAIYKCNDIEMPISSRTDEIVNKDSESVLVDSESPALEVPENLESNVNREKQHLLEPFCDVCHESFENWVKLKIHVYESNHLSKCSECEYTTKDKSQLFYHQKNVHKLPLPSFLTSSSYRCSLCPFEIHKLSFARYHMKNVHSKMSISVIPNKDSDKPHKEFDVEKNNEEPDLETHDVNENESILRIDNVDHSTENENGEDANGELDDVQDEVDNDGDDDILERQIINADYWNYICYSCGEFTTDELEMREHIVNIHNKKNTYIVANSLIIVKKKETAVYRNKKLSNFVCCSCQYTKSDDTEVRQHIKDEHNGMAAYQVRPQGRQYTCLNKRTYNNICFKCQQEFQNMTERDNHIRIMNHQLFCGKCDYSTKSPQWYHFHKCYRHNVPLPKDLEYEAFRCPSCPFLSERSAVEKHIKVSHNLEYEHFCKLCPSRFKARRKLKEHLTQHIPQKYKFGCPDCGHQGVSHHAILKHLQQIHLKNNLKKCPHCPYTAITSSVLNRHLAVHLAPPTMNIKRSMKDKLISEEPQKKKAKLKLQVDTINLPFVDESNNCETIITSNDEPGNDVVVTVITISNDMQNAENLNTTLIENNIDATDEIIGASPNVLSLQNAVNGTSLAVTENNYLEVETEEPSNAIQNEAIANSEDSLHYICFACGHHSLMENDLKQHITDVHENIAIYVESKEFQVFIAMPATCDGYICHSCNHLEISLMEIKSHIKDVHEGVALYRLHPKQETSQEKVSEGHMCWTCNKTFFTRLQLRDHVRKSKHRIQCDLCPWSTVGINYNLLQIHKSIKHHIPLPEDQIHLLYKCPHCTFEHYNEYCSLKHVQKCYSHENAFWCKSCNFGFATYKKLLAHLVRHINEGNWFYCSACTHKSLLAQEVFRHIKSSHCASEIISEEIEGPSPILSQEKTIENQLIRDEINNSINKFKVLNSKSEQLLQNIYTCCNCDYHTTEAISMREHSKTAHEGVSLFEKTPTRNCSSSLPLECMECKEKFTHENLLHTHMIVFNHPAKCSMCPYKTMSLKFLLIHKENKHKISRNMAGPSNTKKLPKKRIYIRASSYLCDLCGTTFPNAALLNWHQQTHPLLKEGPMKKQKNVQCPHCKRKCFDELELNTHIEQRHQLRLEPEFCPICSKVCTSRPRLRAHMLKRHKMGVKAHRRLQLKLANSNIQTTY